jgi:cold shock CspA family protein
VSDDKSRQFGTVRVFFPDKHYGFISSDGGDVPDVFFHVTSVRDGFEIQQDDRVSFDTSISVRNNKAEAIKIERIAGATASGNATFRA